MPYIEKRKRELVEGGADLETAGDLNYIITTALLPVIPRIKKYLATHPKRYQTWNDVFGAMFGACLELIRRKFPEYGEYENQKAEENGDVY